MSLLVACAVAAIRASHSHVAWIAAGARGSAKQIIADALAVLRDGFEPRAEGALRAGSASKRRSTGAR